MSPKTKIAQSKRLRKSTPPALPEASPAPPEEMTTEVIEFITAMDHYKRKNRRPFPNWSEVLRVLKNLGYARPR